jgi:secreted Zn-dependent insulinase-like peptidase
MSLFVRSAFGRDKKKYTTCRLYGQRYWFQGFLARNPTVVLRKSQKHESGPFPKANRFIAKDYSDKLREFQLDITDKPERIYSVALKECNYFFSFRLRT